MELCGKIKKYGKNEAGRLWEYAQAFIITAVIARLFYRSWIALLLVVPVTFGYRKYCKRKKETAEKRQFLKEFGDCLEMVSASLLAGYSLENAFLAAQKEMRELHGAGGRMQEALEKINKQVGMNQPLEKAFREAAIESQLEEVENFSEILVFTKRGGGDFVEIIRRTVENISEKIRIEEEIQTLIAEKKLEQRVMNVAPLMLIFYLDITSPGYLDVLYGNLPGVLLMTLCLFGYFGAILISERMGRIEV